MDDMALSPREIQSRIRAGASLEEVAQAAGLPADQIEPFALPVLAEREHVVGQALSCPVRKRGESSSARSMRQVVREHLQDRGIDIDGLDWDSWREPDRRWVVRALGEGVDASFIFDTRARFSMARDDQARELIGEPLPGAPAPRDPDSEPTVEIQDSQEPSRVPEQHAAAEPEAPRSPTAEVAALVERVTSAAAAQAQEQADEPGNLPMQSQLDVLYDMLSAFDEESVNIYADLATPIIDEPLLETEAEPAVPVNDDLPEAAAAEEETTAQAEGITQERPDQERPDQERQEPVLADEPADEPAASASAASEKEISEPEQDALVEAPTPKPRPRARKGRASVPSWDEIMFGGPRPSK